MPSVPVLRSTLSLYLGSPRFPSYHWSFLFPQTRPTNLPTSGPVFNIIRAVDSIQTNFSSCSVDIPTILRLPFLSLLQHALPPSHPLAATFSPPSTILQSSRTIRRNLFGSDIFKYDSFTRALHFRQSFRHLPHPCASRRAVYMIHDHRLLLNTFTLHNMSTLTPQPLLSTAQLSPTSTPNIESLHSLLTSMISSTHFDPETHQFQQVAASTKGFKSLPSSNPPSSRPPILKPAKWKKFWSLSIPLNARNTWFRVLHKKITTKDLLHSRQPTIYHPFCDLCHSSRDTIDHFLFTCPLKHSFWSSALDTYMPPAISHNTFSNFQKFLFLEHPPSRHGHPLFSDLSVHQVFACMLQTVWRYHYQHVFNDTPFLPSLLLSSLHNTLYILHSQENLDQFP
ncbi:hypothetical protein HMPREF1544_02316 [Mucor circinelloides 1006PhL]|uniref:Reverse transcriptase zinc-binding domain-containing protein n=1 Tax=Mucor circinelloides f. circinelloides (strain 1006PhL) TaxID=1220926 RepID=S2K6A9_MUCC1|nr:hypothetical protein HMPREF1544_02316 [Mucor circinelloides 1006PhL]